MFVLNLKIDSHKVIDNEDSGVYSKSKFSDKNSSEDVILSSKYRHISKRGDIIKKPIAEDLTEEQQKYLKLYDELHEGKTVSHFKTKIYIEKRERPNEDVIKPERKSKKSKEQQEQIEIKTIQNVQKEEYIQPTTVIKETIETPIINNDVDAVKIVDDVHNEDKKEFWFKRFWKKLKSPFRKLFKKDNENN